MEREGLVCSASVEPLDRGEMTAGKPSAGQRMRARTRNDRVPLSASRSWTASMRSDSLSSLSGSIFNTSTSLAACAVDNGSSSNGAGGLSS